MSSLSYVLRRHHRAKRLRISISRDRRVLVTIPSRYPKRLAEKFVRDKAVWIRATLEKLPDVPVQTAIERRRQVKSARALVTRLVNDFAARYGFRHGAISIRNQRTRWGSCTKDGKLSFNARIVSLSTELQDYIVVHELCHLQEFNHSKKFWALVGQTIPDYHTRRKQLRGRMM